MAARLRRELGVEVEETEGHYGELTVLVDGAPAVKGGPFAFVGVLPSIGRVVADVKEKLAASAAR